MSNRCRPPITVALPLAAVIATAVAIGCGGSGDDGSNACGQTEASGSSSASPGRLTPTGTTLKIGQAGIVNDRESGPGGRIVKSRVEVTPTKLEKGSSDDFDNVELEPSQKSSTPYYVEVCVTNVGSGDLSKTDPSGGLTGVDERDESQTSVTFIGDFNRCKSSVDPPASLKKGESFGTCLVFLIPKGGGSLAKLEWSGGEVIWKP